MTDKPKDLVVLARNVRRLRHHREWSQRRLAEACNLDRTTIVKIERGDHRPSVLTLELLARAFGKPTEFLFFDPDSCSNTTLLLRGLIGQLSPRARAAIVAYAKRLTTTPVSTS